MTSSEKCDKKLVDDSFLSDNGFGNFGLQPVSGILQLGDGFFGHKLEWRVESREWRVSFEFCELLVIFVIRHWSFVISRRANVSLRKREC